MILTAMGMATKINLMTTRYVPSDDKNDCSCCDHSSPLIKNCCEGRVYVRIHGEDDHSHDHNHRSQQPRGHFHSSHSSCCDHGHSGHNHGKHSHSDHGHDHGYSMFDYGHEHREGYVPSDDEDCSCCDHSHAKPIDVTMNQHVCYGNDDHDHTYRHAVYRDISSSNSKMIEMVPRNIMPNNSISALINIENQSQDIDSGATQTTANPIAKQYCNSCDPTSPILHVVQVTRFL
jgi:hypothetical protein